jgi:hypothetical protein
MPDSGLIQVSPGAEKAFGDYDFTAQAPRDAIRIFVQGFG